MTITRPLLGFDCAQPITQAILPALSRSGAGFAIRYYTPDFNSAKDLTQSEIALVSAAIPDLVWVSVFETQAARALTGADAGALDAYGAGMCGVRLRQPVGSAIYFAVDFDALPAQVAGPISAYFKTIRNELSFEAKIGVYGNGLTCQGLLDNGLVDLTWLAGGMGMQGSRQFLLSGRWNLLQHVGDEAQLGLGIAIDSDEAQEEGQFGAWKPASAPASSSIQNQEEYIPDGSPPTDEQSN